MTSAPAPETDSIPLPDASTPAATSARPTARARIAASLSDPVLRVLATATLIGTLGRGVVLTMTVLYFTLVVGLSAGEVAVIMSVAAGVGVATSYLGGHFADRLGARRLVIVFAVLDAIALAAYPFTTSFWPALIAVSCAIGFERAGNSARSAIIARAFEGPRRVTTRAVLRTVTNIGIAIGGALAGVALLIGTPEAYRVIMVAAGAVYLVSALLLRRLPRGVGEATALTRPSHPDAVAAPAGRSPWRDRRYLALAALSGIFAMQFGLSEVGVPLWVAHDTEAPESIVSLLLILNTVLVIAFQVPASRGTHDVRRAGTVTAIAGVLMAGACLLYAGAGGVGVALAITCLVLAAIAHAAAEILSQAGAWGLSFELADPERAGAYQGVFGMGFSLGALCAPLVVTGTALTHGFVGWVALGALFLAAALGITAIGWRAARARISRDRVA